MASQSATKSDSIVRNLTNMAAPKPIVVVPRLFRKLPNEIREMIWELVFSEGRILQARLRKGKGSGRELAFWTANQVNMTQVCRYFRAIALESGKFVFGDGGGVRAGLWWNRDTDVFHIDAQFLKLMGRSLRGLEGLENVVRVAVEHEVLHGIRGDRARRTSLSSFCKKVREHFPSVEHISVLKDTTTYSPRQRYFKSLPIVELRERGLVEKNQGAGGMTISLIVLRNRLAQFHKKKNNDRTRAGLHLGVPATMELSTFNYTRVGRGDLTRRHHHWYQTNVRR